MAIEAQGTKLEISGTTGAAVTEMTAKAGYPTILTKTNHGLSNGDVGTLSDFLGTDAALMNSKVVIVRYVTDDTFAVAIDTTGATLTAANGTITPLEWVEIGEVVSHDGPGGSAAVYETTHLRSTAKEKKAGLLDEGPITLAINWCLATDPGQQEASEARKDRTEKNFKLTFSDLSTASFSGYVLGMSASGAVDDKVSGSITIEITGAVAWSHE
jgi:hypothetical protein